MKRVPAWCCARCVIAVTALLSAQVCRANMVIVPTFASNITSDPNAAAIQGAINAAISVYQSRFSDPITVNIMFQEGGGLGGSSTAIGAMAYTSILGSLTADATTADDATALAHLPLTLPALLNPDASGQVFVTTANFRALGINITPGGTACGGFGCDGTITLNTSFTSPGSPGSTLDYDLQVVAEHEIDEVLGLGSGLNLPVIFPRRARMQDLFRYDNAGSRSFDTSGSVRSFFSIDGTTLLVEFNQNGAADYGDWKTGAAPQVQDAFATIGAHPVLGVELRNLDVIGYNLTAIAVPEPATSVLFALGLVGLGVMRRRSGIRRDRLK